MSEEVILCVSWRSDVMPVSAYNYCHASCYDAENDRRINKEVRPVVLEDLAVSATCDACGEWLNIVEKGEQE